MVALAVRLLVYASLVLERKKRKGKNDDDNENLAEDGTDPPSTIAIFLDIGAGSLL